MTGRKREIYLVSAVILLGAVLRLAMPGTFPPGLNQDEASEGYEAWALLRSGIDRCGNSWPALFVSWGSGQNVLYAYLAMPVVALFGLTVSSLRFVSAFWGTVSLPAVYLLGRRLWGKEGGVAALVLTAFCPWHITVSRWALEANLLPAFLLLGLWLLAESPRRHWCVPLAGSTFALCLYAYGTAFVFLLFFLPPVAVCARWRWKVPWKHCLAALGIFAVLAAPIVLTNLRNFLRLPSATMLGITLPELVQSRAVSTTALGGSIGAYLQNFADGFLMLLRQEDGLVYNSVGRLLPPGALLLAALGLGELAYRGLRGRLRPGESAILWAAVAGLCCLFVISPNLNRLNFALFPTVLLAASGFCVLLRWCKAVWLRRGVWITGAVLTMLTLAVFAGKYTGEGADTLKSWFFDGLGEAIEYAAACTEGDIQVTDSVNMPYIFVLFYTRTPPEEFLSLAEYENPDAEFRRVSSMGRWHFSSEDPPEGTVYICYPSQAGNREILAAFGGFVVCR